MIVNPTDYNWTPFNSNGVQKGIKKTDSSVVIYRFVGSGSGVYMYAYDSNTIDNIISSVVGGIPDGVVVDGGINVSDIANGNITTGIFEYRLTIGGIQQTYTSNSTGIFSGIPLSSTGTLRIIAFYGDANGDTIKVEGPEGDGTTMPIQPADTTLLGYTIVSDSDAGTPVIDTSNFAKLNGGNTFSGMQVVQNSVIAALNSFIRTNRRLEFFRQDTDPSQPFPSSIPNFGFGINDVSSNNFTLERYTGGGESSMRLLEVLYASGVFDFKVIPSINGSDISTVSYVDAGLATKLDITAYNQYYRGVFPTEAALRANVFVPPPKAGDNAQVDAGSGSPVRNFSWDANDNDWIEGGSGSGAVNTDALPEGTTNLYFTAARVLATLLTGYTVGTNTALAATDSILAAFGKIQAQLNGKMTQRTITGTTNQVNVSNGDGVSGNPTLSLPQNIHAAATPQFAGLGLGLAASAAAFQTIAAATTTKAQYIQTSFSGDYTGTVPYASWNNQGEFKWYDPTIASINRQVKLYNNELLKSSGNYSLSVNQSGDILATNKEIEAYVYDTDLITAITSATYTNNEATIAVSGKTVYQGQKYYDATTHYIYEAWDDNKIFRR